MSNTTPITVFLLACLPLVALSATNASDRIEVRSGTEVVRITPGADEPASSGSYDIRVYDATNGAELAFVDGLVLSREGSIRKAWYCDLNGDGLPELVVWVVSSEADAHGQLDIFNWVDGRLERIEMPEMASSWKRGYKGRDAYRIDNGVLYRVFPLYKGSESEARPTGGERTLKLIYEKERWMWRLHAVK